jgi:hypothetical protein
MLVAAFRGGPGRGAGLLQDWRGPSSIASMGVSDAGGSEFGDIPVEAGPGAAGDRAGARRPEGIVEETGAAADRRARDLASRLRGEGLVAVAANAVASLMPMEEMAEPGTIAAARAAIAWSWRRQAELLPPGDEAAMRLYLDAERLERAPDRGELEVHVGREAARTAAARRGAEYVRAGRALQDFGTPGISQDQVEAKLHLAKQIIDDLTASIEAGGLDGPLVNAYAADRGELAIGALQALDLPGLLDLAGLRDDPNACSAAERLSEIMTGLLSAVTDRQAADISLTLGLLRSMDGAISGLLADSRAAGQWESTARALLQLAAQLIVAAGVALVVAAGSMLSVGQVPLARADIQAVVAGAIRAVCGLLQHDLPALWREHDFSAHLRAADKLLRASADSLTRVLTTACDDRSPGQEAALRQVATRAFAVEFAAYMAGRLAAAVEGWAQGRLYCDAAKGFQDICHQISQKPGPASLSKLAGELLRSAGRIEEYRVPGNLALRPDADLSWPDRWRAIATPLGQLNPEVRNAVNRPADVRGPVSTTPGGRPRVMRAAGRAALTQTRLVSQPPKAHRNPGEPGDPGSRPGPEPPASRPGPSPSAR